MKKRIIIPLCIIALFSIIIGIYFYNCMNYWKKDYRKTINAGFVEKQIRLKDGSIINYAEGPNNGKALLLIHGQTGAWEDYIKVLSELSKNWHIFAIDCYGHGGSSHDIYKYYLDKIGDDLIWFIGNVIGKETVVSGHSSGGLIAAYIAAFSENFVTGVVLEDPPVFSTEEGNFENSFAYHDTYKPIYEYINSDQNECWEAFYMRNCLWGKLYMPQAMNGLANFAQNYHIKNPENPIQYFFMPESINFMFLFSRNYDLKFGENFYNYSWHSGIRHEDLMKDINIPTIFIHAEENYSDNGILMAASSNTQARQAVELIGNCELIELKSNHNIHRFNPKVFINAIKKML